MTAKEKAAAVRILPLPEGMARMESGPVQFGQDDWPGYFLRGDNAMQLLSGLDLVESILKQYDNRPSTMFWVSSSLGWINSMRSCILQDDEPQPVPGEAPKLQPVHPPARVTHAGGE